VKINGYVIEVGSDEASNRGKDGSSAEVINVASECGRVKIQLDEDEREGAAD
jgi:hypothetical protein